MNLKTLPVAAAALGGLLLGGAASALAGHPAMTVSAGKLAKDAKDFYGKTVSVKAEVEDVFGSHAFTLDEDALFAGPDVLVLVPRGTTTASLRHDDMVTVTGLVRPYVTAELDRDFDWFEEGMLVKKEMKIDYKTRPVLVATSVRTADGRDLLLLPATAEHSAHTMPSGKVRKEIPAATIINAGKLAGSAKEYYGRRVTVRAEVEDVYDGRSFSLDEDALFAGPDVLVLLPRGSTASLAHDMMVTVTGTVRPYVATELKKDYDWFEGGKLVKKSTKIDFKTRPVIVADSVRTSAGAELVTGATSLAARSEHKQHMAHAGTMDLPATTISAGKLARDAKNFYGKRVSVRAEVEDVFDSNSFTLDEDALFSGPDVLVLLPKGAATTLKHDEWVVVTGVVRPYVSAELERDFDWFKDGKLIKKDVKVDFETRPVIVADSVRSASGTELVLR